MSTNEKHQQEKSENRFMQNIKRLSDIKGKHLLLLIIGIATIYCFGIGRARYKVTSVFIIRQANSTKTNMSGVLGGIIGTGNANGSLEDGRILEVYLKSPEVMKKVFINHLNNGKYNKKTPDIFAGIKDKQTNSKILNFYKKQISVTTKDQSGIVTMDTFAYDPIVALELNKNLITSAREFVNEVNNNMSERQLKYAKDEIEVAEKNLKDSSAKLSRFNTINGLLSPSEEIKANSNLITTMESKLVELKVEEGSLKRLYIDQKAPEIVAISDQIKELSSQIQKERDKQFDDNKRSLGSLVAESNKLRQQVEFDSERLKSAKISENTSRMGSQQKLKFLVTLSKPINPQTQDLEWRYKLYITIILILISLKGILGFILGQKPKNQ